MTEPAEYTAEQLPEALRQLMASPELSLLEITHRDGVQVFVKLALGGVPHLWPLFETSPVAAAAGLREQLVEGPARLVHGVAPVDVDRFVAAEVEGSVLVTGDDPVGSRGSWAFGIACRRHQRWFASSCGGIDFEEWMLEDDADRDELLDELDIPQGAEQDLLAVVIRVTAAPRYS